MEKAATDIYSFRKLRENSFTYVDKTAMTLPLCDMTCETPAGIWLIEFKLEFL